MNPILKFTTYIMAAVSIFACTEDEFSKDYDIKLPESTITKIEPATAFIDEVVTLTGINMNDVSTVYLGSSPCDIIEKNATTLKFKVNRTADRSQVTITNKYKRTFVSAAFFAPIYKDVKVNQWPTKIEKGKSFIMDGENMDLIVKVSIDNKVLERVGIPTSGRTSYSVKGMNLSDQAILVVSSRTGQLITSNPIDVVEAEEGYLPQASLLLMDFDTTDPTIIAGNATGSGAVFFADKNLAGIPGGIHNYWSVKADEGNGWNGSYQRLKADNNGKGYDLSQFTKPHLTFLVNTNGKSGYFNPNISIGGTASDKHFTGQGMYTDNYKITTTGWEWRSYDLEAMGFDGIKGQVDFIELLIRGGNVLGVPFELNIDQVMFTDGPLNLTLLWDFATLPNITNGNGQLNGGSGITVPEGENYLTIKKTGVSNWNSLGEMIKNGIDRSENPELLYLNFLLNTGANEGYFQIIFKQNGSEFGMHFKDKVPYEDNYKFKTDGKWQWRSYQIESENLQKWSGDAVSFNINAPFDFIVSFSTGNVAGAIETNIDYLNFSSVPMDPVQH